MHWLDWTILLGTLGFIVGYGVWRTRHTSTLDGYLRGDNQDRWWAVMLSVMATQASAITFLSTPGQGFLDGMGFVQFYFGLPLAMVVIAFVFIPLFYKWNVYTAYEFIGKRFDHRTRLLTALLFLIQRGLSTGITIYAPSIVLSKVLHWPLGWTCVFIGALVILYTTTGGAKAVGVTHKQQMAVMFGGLFVVFGFILYYLKDAVSFGEGLRLAGAMGKMNVIDTSWDPKAKYTLWSGLIGGFFLQLSYFGTDQSQVQRYLSGQTAQQARSGLLMNGLVKIPMQFFILLIGVMVFVFYLFHASPVHWNAANVELMGGVTAESQSMQRSAEELRDGPHAETRSARGNADHALAAADALEAMHAQNAAAIASAASAWVAAERNGSEGDAAREQEALDLALARDATLRAEYTTLVRTALPAAEPNDKDYIFISFIMDHMPVGIVGLLLAMIFCAGMGSTSSQLSALATTSVVDVFRFAGTGEQQVVATKWATVVFGILALTFAAVFSLFENLIQAVNILGSLFYGTILGIFLVAFFLKRVQGTAVFVAALISQAAILFIHFTGIEIAFLWYNLIAPAIVVVLAVLLQTVLTDQRTSPA
jgi:Na+/proline symporter